MILLSILIPTTYDREDMTDRLASHIRKQCESRGSYSLTRFHDEEMVLRNNTHNDKIEILTLIDNKKNTTGYKRNVLYENASGKYSISCDSDDWVPDYYIEELLKAAESDADCFGINGIMITDNIKTETWNISKDNPYKTVRGHMGNHYLRFPNHITPIKSEICKQFKFPDVSYGEDFAWATQIHESGLIKSEYTITKPMYEYRYSSVK